MAKKLLFISIFLIILTIILFFFNRIKTPTANSNNTGVTLLSPALVDIFIDLKLEDKINCYAGPLDKNEKEIMKKASKIGLYHAPILEKIIACRSSLIITSYNGTPPQIFYALKKLGIEVILYKAKTINDIISFYKKIAKRFNVSIPQKLKNLENLCFTPKLTTNGKILISTQPIFLAGSDTFISNAVRCAGFKNIETGGYKKVALESILADKNNKLFILSDGMGEDQSIKKIKSSGKLTIFKDNNFFKPSLKILDSITRLKKELKSDKRK